LYGRHRLGWERDTEPDVTIGPAPGKINEAIARGVAHLKAAQAADGTWSSQFQHSGDSKRFRPSGGLTACALYALSASGVPREDASMQRALEWIRTHPDAFAPGSGSATYATSILVLALTRIDAKGLKAMIHHHTASILKGMHSDGMWSYPLAPDRGQPPRGPGADRAAWRKSGTGFYQIPDNSNTQFAVLALWAAYSLSDYDVPQKAWEKIRQNFLKGQLDDGAWSYRKAPKSPSLTMTAAGLVSLVYAAAALDECPKALENARKHPAIRTGLKTLWRMGRRGGRLAAPYNFYWLYSLERVGTVLALEDASWYVEGAQHLVDNQDKIGAWPKWSPALAANPTYGVMPHKTKPVQWSRVYETSLALLFLSRATLPPKKGVTTPPDNVPVPKRETTRTERFPDLIDPSPGREKRVEQALILYALYNKERRAAVAPLFGSVGPAIVKRCIEKLESDEAQTREGAFDLLGRLLDVEFTFDPAWPEHRRRPMIRPFERFWTENGERLVWDPERKRFTVEAQ
jgi:hypothetical protein